MVLLGVVDCEIRALDKDVKGIGIHVGESLLHPATDAAFTEPFTPIFAVRVIGQLTYVGNRDGTLERMRCDSHAVEYFQKDIKTSLTTNNLSRASIPDTNDVGLHHAMRKNLLECAKPLFIEYRDGRVLELLFGQDNRKSSIALIHM